MLRKHWRFLVLLTMYLTGVLTYSHTLPLMEASDEILHYTYVETVRATSRLPDRTTYLSNCVRQESGQPPLVYLTGVLLLKALQLPEVDCRAMLDAYTVIKNPWLTPVDPWNRGDNVNMFFHDAASEATIAPEILIGARALRYIVVAFGVLAVIAAYGVAREVFAREKWALTATALFAFTPTMVHLSAYFNNDVPMVAFCTLTLWLTLRALRLGVTPLRLAVIGLCLALGMLTKISATLVAPGVGVMLLLDWCKRGYPFRQVIVNGLIVAVVVGVLFLPWVAYGIATFNDPLGLKTHGDPRLNRAEALPISETVERLSDVYLGYLGKFGFQRIYMHPVTYTALGVVVGAAVLGYGVWLIRRRVGAGFKPAPTSIILIASALTVFVVFIYWLRTINFVSGRLLYPAHVVVSVGLAGGLYLLARSLPRLDAPLRTVAVTTFAVCGLVLPSVSVSAVFRLPDLLTEDELPSLRGPQIDYNDTIRLLGYHMEERAIVNRRAQVTLCWEVLQPTEDPAAFSLKFVRDGEIVADRTSLFGMGRFLSHLWRPGDTLCDTVDVSTRDPDIPEAEQVYETRGTVYDVLLVLLDARTQQVDWQPTTPDGMPVEFPIIAQVVAPAGDMSSTIDIALDDPGVRFPGFAALAGVSADGLQPGAQATLHLLWHVDATTPDDWTQFIHLTGDDVSVPLYDSPPRGGAYPTWAWSAGERVADSITITLPDDLPPGRHDLVTGFYRQDTGDRMPVTQNGDPAPANAGTIAQFTVQ